MRFSLPLRLLMIATSLVVTPATAKHMGLEYLAGEYSTSGVRVTMLPHDPRPLSFGGLRWHLESSLNQWQQSDATPHNQVTAIALSPVLTKQIGTLGESPLFWEFGIGISLLDERLFAHKDLGSHFQFEDRIGLAIRFSERHSLSLRYLHYSNAGLASRNPGMDFLNLAYRRRF